MKSIRKILLVTIIFGCASSSFAQFDDSSNDALLLPNDAATVPARTPEMADPGDRPAIPYDAAPWAGSMVIISAALFLTAMVIGPIVQNEIAASSAVS